MERTSPTISLRNPAHQPTTREFISPTLVRERQAMVAHAQRAAWDSPEELEGQVWQVSASIEAAELRALLNGGASTEDIRALLDAGTGVE